MNELTDPVSYTVEKCLAYAARHESPTSAACDFIAVLKIGGAMTDRQIAGVAHGVIAKLAERATQARFVTA